MQTIPFAYDAAAGLVSIVIPAYRADRYLGATLATVERQSYPDWEIVVVEDGPPGATQTIVEEFARRNPSRRVHYSSLGRNFGPSHARNVAFGKVKGEFVALLDADDRWFPDFLAESTRQLANSQIDITYSSVVMIDDETNLLLDVHGPRAKELAEFPHGLFRENFITPSATVLRRTVLEQVGAWNTAYRYCEDLEYWLRCLAAGKRFQHVGGCHCLYRKNHASSATVRACAVYEAFAEVIEPFIALPGLKADTCRRYVSKAYRRAGRLHAKTDPAADASANPARAAPMMLKAWRLRPHRIDYLLESAKYAVANRFRRRPTRPAAPSPTESAPTRAAA